MNRRGFLSLFGMGIGGIAIEQAIPLGRVWSFPKKIVIPLHQFDYTQHYNRALAQMAVDYQKFWNEHSLAIGDIVSVKGVGGFHAVNHVFHAVNHVAEGFVGLERVGLSDHEQYFVGTAPENCLKHGTMPVFLTDRT